MNRILRILKWPAIVIGLFFIGFIAFVQLTWDKEFDAPLPEIVATTDSAMIARGQHLAFGPAHCGTCHVPLDKLMEVENGLIMPLQGGWAMSIPPGTFRAPNITPDEETGIGALSDGQLARALRYSVKSDNTCLFPFMPFQELSDEDLTAIISFLRSQEPVRNEVPPTELTFLGKMVMALGMIKPVGPTQAPPKKVDIDSTVAYGKYLANNVANCVGCHTERDLKTGEFTGAPFAGGLLMPDEGLSDGFGFVTPNITPHQGTGHMVEWDEKEFIKRFRGGRVYKGTPMPWGSFGRMTDLELKAIYRYLKSLDPVENKIEKVVYAPGEELPH